MTNEEIRVLQEFMQRVTLKATEVPAFTKAMEALHRESLINNKLEEEGPVQGELDLD